VHILLADDDQDILVPLNIAMQREGYITSIASDGEQAWDLFVADRPDLAVLDYNMPGIDGLGLTRRIAGAGEPRVPIIVLTGRTQERDKVKLLDAGADDYLIKPFSSRELFARIRAVLRRAGTPAHFITSGDLAIDPATHRFFLLGREVDITSNEFALLHALIERAGKVVRYSILMNKVWGCEVSNDLLRVTVYRLRSKIEPDPRRPRYIQTVPGVGLRMDAPPSAEERDPAGVLPPLPPDEG